MGGHSRVLVDPADPTPNRRHIARSLGLLFLIEGTLGEAWLLLPHEAGETPALLLVGARVAIANGQFVTSEMGSWLLPAATIIVVSWIVHQLTRELGRSDRERLVSERERAEAEARRAASERERAHREAAMARLAGLALRA